MQQKLLPNMSLMALAASYLIQIGAGVFALAVIGRVVSAAPPRSLSMLQGPYGYDSGTFWQIMPAITGLLFVIALVANWKTPRRVLLIAGFAIFLVGGAITGAFLAPLFADLVAVGLSDVVDPVLQRRASLWYLSDWGVRGVDAIGGALLLVALTRPVTRS